jgi:hypothetical protein
MISFIGRQYYRLVQGAGTVGLAVSAFFLVVNTYGIWKQSLEYYSIPLAPFAILGFIALVFLYWGGGFSMERIGLYREYQMHSNLEINPQWLRVYTLVEKMAEKLEVEE